MINRNDARTFVRLQRKNLKARLCRFYTSTLDAKAARTYTDDIDVCRGANRRFGYYHHSGRPGLRDDDRSSAFITMLRV